MPTPELPRALKRALEADPLETSHGAPRLGGRSVVVLGVGSELRSDDAAGVRVSAALARKPLPGVYAIDGGSAPENCTAAIRHLAPTHLIIVDAAELSQVPGTIRVLACEEIGSAGFGTHALPLSVLADYLQKEVGCRVTVIGIQPKSLVFGQTMSPEVSAAVAETVGALRECLAAPA
jgi:hydrogenase 3 maturation protease